MQLIKNSETTYILIMKKGEKVMECFKKAFEVIKTKNPEVEGGFISGTIGALDESMLSYRNNDTKKYDHKMFNESMEIVSMSGNLSFKPKNQFFAHIHVGLSGSDYVMYGGHLTSARVSITVECMITITKVKLQRENDSDTGLDLINFKESLKEKEKNYWQSDFKKGDKVKVIRKNDNTASMAKVGQVYTLKSQTENDQERRLWTTEELGFWCISEFCIEKIN